LHEVGVIMETLPVHLALHGVVVLVLSFIAGLLLHRAIRLRQPGVGAWHLAHAGTSGRGVMLLAMAGTWPWLDLPAVTRLFVGVLLLVFVWTSVAAMLIAAATGHRGLTWEGSTTDRAVYGLYVAGTVAIFPAAVLLIAGFARAL
jgi:hypothetical protein